MGPFLGAIALLVLTLVVFATCAGATRHIWRKGYGVGLRVRVVMTAAVSSLMFLLVMFAPVWHNDLFSAARLAGAVGTALASGGFGMVFAMRRTSYLISCPLGIAAVMTWVYWPNWLTLDLAATVITMGVIGWFIALTVWGMRTETGSRLTAFTFAAIAGVMLLPSGVISTMRSRVGIYMLQGHNILPLNWMTPAHLSLHEPVMLTAAGVVPQALTGALLVTVVPFKQRRARMTLFGLGLAAYVVYEAFRMLISEVAHGTQTGLFYALPFVLVVMLLCVKVAGVKFRRLFVTEPDDPAIGAEKRFA